MAEPPSNASKALTGAPERTRVASDSAFQARLRELQSLWRTERGYPIGQHRDQPLGSRLEMPLAEEQLLNYLTPTIRDLVRREVIEPEHNQRKLYSRPRIFDDLLSSQPLCFNLFGELAEDLNLATAVCRELWPERVSEVTAIEFEWSPGRADPRYLDNRSAFDVIVFHTTPAGGRGFVGIEVKYHEDLDVKPAAVRPRCLEVAGARRYGRTVFGEPVPDELLAKPLQQIWLDHLLALSMLQADDGFSDGLFVFLHPADNRPCSRAAARYASRLADASTFQPLTLEDVVTAIRRHTSAPWIDAFHDRYLSFDKLADPGDLPVDTTNPLPALDDPSVNADELLLARFVIGSIRMGGTMFDGRLHECRVARLVGGDLAPRGVWPWDVKLSDGTRLEVRSSVSSFEIDGGRHADVWVFARKARSAAPGSPPECYFVAPQRYIDELRKTTLTLNVRRATDELRRCDGDGLAAAVRDAAATQRGEP